MKGRLKINHKDTRFFENLNFPQFETDGEYDIPIIKPYDYSISLPTEYIGFDKAKSTKST